MQLFYFLKQEQQKFGHTLCFQGWVGGLNQKHHFDILPDRLGIYGHHPFILTNKDWEGGWGVLLNGQNLLSMTKVIC